MKHRRLFSGILTFGLGCGCFFGVRGLRSQALLSSTKTPYSMRVHERTFMNGTGPALNEKEYLFAVRSDGSTSQIFIAKDNDGKEIWISRTIRDLSERKRIFVAEAARSMTTNFFSKDAVLAAKANETNSTCTSGGPYLVPIGSGEYLGYKVIKIRNNAGTDIMLEHWAAPDLNCAYIYSKWYFKNPDNTLHHTTEQAAVSIAVGEPPEEFFSTSSDLVEKSPSGVVLDLTGPVAPSNENENFKNRLDKMDQAYYDSRR